MSVNQAIKEIGKARDKIVKSDEAIDDGKYDRAKNRNAEADERLVKALDELDEDEEDGGSGNGGGNGDDGLVDDIDPTSLTYLHADVSGWAITSDLTSVEISASEICLYHSKAGHWPEIDGIEGNPWIVAKVDGVWYAATYEWLRPGQVCKKLGVPDDQPDTANALGPHIKKAPLDKWVPQLGETVYLFVSTFARDSKRTDNERSQMVEAVWPYQPAN